MILEVCWDGLWTLSFGLSQFHGHGSWLVCEVALTGWTWKHWDLDRVLPQKSPRVLTLSASLSLLATKAPLGSLYQIIHMPNLEQNNWFRLLGGLFPNHSQKTQT
jgi:hypothetical protein